MKTGYKMVVSGVGGAAVAVIAGAALFGFSSAQKSNSQTTSNTPKVIIQVGPAKSVYSSRQNEVYATIQQLVKNVQNKKMDASGFVQYVFEKSGLKLPRTFAEQAQVGRLVQKPNQLKRGDLVCFNLLGSGDTVTFVGIYLENNQFVAVTTHGIMVLSLKDPYWSSKFKFGRRVL